MEVTHYSEGGELVAISKGRTARTFNEIMAANEPARPPSRAEIEDMVKASLAKIAKANPLPVQVERITTERTSSSIAVEMSSYIETNRKPDESVSAAWHRLSIDPKVTEMYAAYRDTVAAEMNKSVAMNPSDPKQAAIERDAVEKEIMAAARNLMGRDNSLSLPSATAKALDQDPQMYARYMAAKARQTGG